MKNFLIFLGLAILLIDPLPLKAQQITNPPTPAIKPFIITTQNEPRLTLKEKVQALRDKVKYVFIIYQENRSFDHYFGTFPGADGLFSQPAIQTKGFYQTIIDTNGQRTTIHPFRMGPRQYASDTDDIDHAHSMIVKKMHIVNGKPEMNRFALTEERKYSPTGKPSLEAKQFGELAMAYVDGNTIPFLWNFANRFVLFDHFFQEMAGPSTPGNLSIIAAQTGVTEWILHPNLIYQGNGDRGRGVPVLDDPDPFWGSPADTEIKGERPPVNPHDFPKGKVNPGRIEYNLTFASLPLTLQGKTLHQVSKLDEDPDEDLEDIRKDIADITQSGRNSVSWGWYEEGYDHEPTDDDLGPIDAEGSHASYVTHHNGPQYFGYISNNPKMREHLHGLDDFYQDLKHHRLSPKGGVFYIKGGFKNILNLKPADPDPRVQKNFLGDDDHPAYSDAQISEAHVAETVNAIAKSPYWKQCAVIITWDDSEGDYDHVPPPIKVHGPHGSVISEGPRVPLIMISPYSKVHYISHEQGNHASVVKFADTVFGLKPLADLPDEKHARKIGERKYKQKNLGPQDALTPGIGNLLSAFDNARLTGKAKPLPASYALTPEKLIHNLPQKSGYGNKNIGIIPVDKQRHIPNKIPKDFNPRPKTTPNDGD
ncbi:MAG TPA: alkaline phosphatase family protein [Balneolales bacterium]|nr:alkaline phosphatase family protein [Balneolales bacterium]